MSSRREHRSRAHLQNVGEGAVSHRNTGTVAIVVESL